jgi:hypothetical protein
MVNSIGIDAVGVKAKAQEIAGRARASSLLQQSSNELIHQSPKRSHERNQVHRPCHARFALGLLILV